MKPPINPLPLTILALAAAAVALALRAHAQDISAPTFQADMLGMNLPADLQAARKPTHDKWTFTFLPTGLQSNPLAGYAIIGKLTDTGRNLPPPAFAKPVYYISHSMGQRNYSSPMPITTDDPIVNMIYEKWFTPRPPTYTSLSMGQHEAGNLYSGMKDIPYAALKQQLLNSLAANGYRPADTAHPPSQLLIFTWGFRGVEPALELAGQRDFLRGDDETSANASMEVIDRPVDPELEYYYLLVTSLDVNALKHNKRKILWTTKISTVSQGISFQATLPIMIDNASYFFGRETRGTQFLVKRAYKKATVDIGEMSVVDYITGTAKPATSGTTTPTER